MTGTHLSWWKKNVIFVFFSWIFCVNLYQSNTFTDVFIHATNDSTVEVKWSEAAAEVHDILQDDIHHEDVDLFWSGTSGWADNCFLLLFLSALYLFPQRIIEKKSCIWMCLSIISHYICKKLKKCNKVQSYKSFSSFSSSSGSSLSLCPGSEIHEFWQCIIHVNVQLLNYSQLFSSISSFSKMYDFFSS